MFHFTSCDLKFLALKKLTVIITSSNSNNTKISYNVEINVILEV